MRRILSVPLSVNFGPDGRIYAGGEAGQLFRLTVDGATETVANTGGGIERILNRTSARA
jgi:hypothetical protein